MKTTIKAMFDEYAKSDNISVDELEQSVLNAIPSKFYYSPETATLYFLENNQLCGMPQYQNGTFDLDESFIVEEYNTELAEEHIHPPETENFTTLADVWLKARKVLGA